MYRLLFAAVATLALVGSAFAQTPTAADADFNGNGEVDIPDFLQFVDAYGTQTGDANYDAKFDLDGNGVIGIPDFLIFVDLYGQTVPQVNDPPIADAGEYQSVDKRDMITLNGSNSRDPEGQPLTFTWRQVEGPPLTLPDATIARPTFRTDKAGHYTFELVVSDGVSYSLPDTAVVDVISFSEAAVFVGGDDAAFTYKAMTGNEMVFAAQAGAPQVQVGEVMFNTGKPFFLKKVTRVVRQNASEVVVETEDAALTDVIKEADIRQTIRFPAATKLAVSSVETPELCLKAETDHVGVSCCVQAYNISFGEHPPEIDIEFRIRDKNQPWWQQIFNTIKNLIVGDEGYVEHFSIVAKSGFTASIDISMTGTAMFNTDDDENNIDLSGLPGIRSLTAALTGTVQVGSGAVPLVAQPTLILGGGGEISGKLKTSVHIDKFITVGIEYNYDQDPQVSIINTMENTQDGGSLNEDKVKPVLTGSVGLQAYVHAKLTVYLGVDAASAIELGAGGASLQLGPYIGFNASKTVQNPGIKWDIGWGVNGSAEIFAPFIKILGKTKTVFSVSLPFTLFERTLYEGVLAGPFEANFQGITYNSNNGKFYVLHWNVPEPGGKVYEALKNQDGSWEYDELFDLAQVPISNNRDDRISFPTGIAIYPSLLRPTVYVVGFDNELVSKLYVYSMDSNNEWKQSSVEELLDENRRPLNGVGGVTLHDGRFYMVDENDDKVYVYKYHEQLDWWHDQSKDFNLDGDNRYPLGITYANGRFYVVDGEDDKVYVYKYHEQLDWWHDLSRDFNLDSQNSNPSGITYANGRFYVVDEDDTTIYEYGRETLTIITDANLRAVIADSLGKASGEAITSAEMATLTRLDASNKGIRDLTGLEYATNLTWLDLGGVYVNGEYFNSNAISDFSPVSGLTSLERLDLDSNSITNISPLSGLTNLTWLDLGSSSISDISVLSGLTRLNTLGLYGSSISDISVLSGLTRLEYLVLEANSISDISALSGLTNLTDLWLWDNSISDLAPLVANTGLGYDDLVDVRNNPLSATSINTHIPALEARGVTVYFGASKPAVGEDAMSMPRAAMKIFGADAGERYGSIYRRQGSDKDR